MLQEEEEVAGDGDAEASLLERVTARMEEEQAAEVASQVLAQLREGLFDQPKADGKSERVVGFFKRLICSRQRAHPKSSFLSYWQGSEVLEEVQAGLLASLEEDILIHSRRQRLNESDRVLPSLYEALSELYNFEGNYEEQRSSTNIFQNLFGESG